MAAFDNLMDRLADWLIDNVPGWAAIVIGLFFYPILGLALPLMLRWSIAGVVTANVLGVCGAAVVALGYLAVQVEAANRRHLLDWTTNMRLLTAAEFEWLAGEMFRREGWNVKETGRQEGPDGGIDLILERDGKRSLVQCKRWDSWLVGVDEIRELGGALLREGLPGSSGIFVTLSTFSKAAEDEAARTGITIVKGSELHARMEKVRKSEPCPNCGRPMVLDRSARGWWFRCVAEGCTGKLDLGNEPGRAVELLTEPLESTARPH